jgi:DNA-binding protein HU-beta
MVVGMDGRTSEEEHVPNKAQFVDQLAERLDGDRKRAAAALDAVIDSVYAAIARGERVAITGFGVFERRDRAARTARNPATGASVQVPASRVPAFRPGAEFKAIASGARDVLEQRSERTQQAVARAAASVRDAPGRAAAAVRDVVDTVRDAPAKAASAVASVTRTPAAKSAKKTAKKSAGASKSTAKKAAKKTAAKKSAAKSAAKKTAKKAPAKKSAAKKTASKSTAKKTAAKKTTARKSAAKKTAKKAPAKRR